jgi:hypothetical protein
LTLLSCVLEIVEVYPTPACGTFRNKKKDSQALLYGATECHRRKMRAFFFCASIGGDRNSAHRVDSLEVWDVAGRWPAKGKRGSGGFIGLSDTAVPFILSGNCIPSRLFSRLGAFVVLCLFGCGRAKLCGFRVVTLHDKVRHVNWRLPP